MFKEFGKFNKSIVWFSVGLALLFSVSLVVPIRAQNASLYLSPSTGTYTIGNTFSVAVKVNSGGVAINAAEGTIIFNPNELEVVNLSKSGSVFTLWTTEPTFSNSLGTVDFGGGTPQSFSGASGTIITITFRGKISAASNVNFSSGAVLAADGKGTNVLASMGSGRYTLSPGVITPPADEVPPTEEAPPPTPGRTPAAPTLFGYEKKWRSESTIKLEWKLPPDVIGVSLFLNKSPVSDPGPVSDGLINSKTYENLEDGTWYFHIKFQNNYGWGKISHHEILVDTIPPEPFEIKIDNGGDPTNPTPILYFEAKDSLSGIEYYEVKIGTGDSIPITAAAIKINPFTMPPQTPGEHSIIVKAFDKANNFSQSATKIAIESIQSPIISEFPEKLSPGEALILRGKALTDSTVFVFVQKEGQEPEKFEVNTDKEGNFSFFYPKKPEKGIYKVWAQTQDKRGALSLPSQEISIPVTFPIFLKFGKIAIDYLTTMITLIILIVGAVAVIFYTFYRISLWRKRIRKETKEVAESVNQAFKALREEVQEQIENLDQKPGLTEEEKRIRDKLKEALDVSETFISKEIKDIEKELE